MYAVAVILLTVVLPVASAMIEAVWIPGTEPMALAARWFVFWGVGVRLFLAGAGQVLRPQFTSEGILGIKDPGARAIVRELGFGNLAMGTLGLTSLIAPGWILPAAVAGGVFYGLAGLGHVARKEKGAREWTALITDLLMFTVLAAIVLSRLSWRAIGEDGSLCEARARTQGDAHGEARLQDRQA